MSGMVADKVALVTGGGSGIGRETALLFAAEGARVWIADCSEEKARETAREISARGGEARSSWVDVSEEAAVEQMIEACVREWGSLDCALNGAGIAGPQSPLRDLALQDFERTLDVNLRGVFLCMKHELRSMGDAGRGSIVNMSSGAGWIGTPGLAAYCATKHGVLGLTKTAALENARNGVRVNAVCPGSIDTPMLQASMQQGEAVAQMIRSSMPIGRLGEADEVAEAVVWLCSDRASLVTGASLAVDGAAISR